MESTALAIGYLGEQMRTSKTIAALLGPTLVADAATVLLNLTLRESAQPRGFGAPRHLLPLNRFHIIDDQVDSRFDLDRSKLRLERSSQPILRQLGWITPNRHLLGTMSNHGSSAVNEGLHLLPGENATTVLRENRQVGGLCLQTRRDWPVAGSVHSVTGSTVLPEPESRGAWRYR